MEKLVCEICGGRLIMGQKDTFECESCGSCYSREWVKQKVQEIQGTVKVEGTVQVEGTVKLDGPVEVKGGVNLENLLKRGQIALEDEKWDEAADFFQQALNHDAENAEAYLGLFLAQVKHTTLRYCVPAEDNKPATEAARNTFKRAMQYASPELKQQTETAQAASSFLVQANGALFHYDGGWHPEQAEWETADALYDRVLELDPTKMARHFWVKPWSAGKPWSQCLNSRTVNGIGTGRKMNTGAMPSSMPNQVVRSSISVWKTPQNSPCSKSATPRQGT